MIRIKGNILPSDGHYFVESDGAEIKARSWFGVVRKLRKYRQQNGRPEGNPSEEVSVQACRRHPDLCYDSDESMPMPKPLSLKGRVFNWLAGLKRYKDGGGVVGLVNTSIAQTRQNICLRCPQLSQVGSGCSSCKGALKGLRDAVIGNRSPRSARVGACAVLGTDLTVATNLDEPALDEPQLPVHCWRRRTI